MQTKSNPHVVLLASPGMGHLIPVLELGSRLAIHHRFNVTVFVVAADPAISDSPLLHSLPATLNVVVLTPQINTDPTALGRTYLSVMVSDAVPSMRATISSMGNPPTALVVDMFGIEALVLAREFNMFRYIFITTNAWVLSVVMRLPSLEEKERHEHGVMKMPLNVPGCRPIRFEETLEFLLDNPNPGLWNEFLQLGVEAMMADGILVNTWHELESSTLNELRLNKLLCRVMKTPMIYPVGPLVRPVEPSIGNEIIAWLDKQPKESVVLVSFGSGGTLSEKQMIELAWGLELSRQSFIWVVRPPNDNAMAAYFKANGKRQDGALDFLPEGFLTRTRDVGLMVPTWAPQAEVLSHGSVGAFLSHCGWNSTIESIVNGVPVITWPLYAEQKMNATLLVEEYGMAVRLQPLEAGPVVCRDDIKDVLIGAMDETGKGGVIKARAKELKAKAKEVLAKGGTSYESLSKFAKECELSLAPRLNGKAIGA